MRAFFKSLGYALNGLKLSLAQRSIRIHLGFTVAVICAGFLLHLCLQEWCIIVFSIGLVWSAEVMNTAIEHFVDLVSPQYHEKAGKVKDLAAGAVLIAAIVAAITGLLVFGKHLLDLMPNL